MKIPGFGHLVWRSILLLSLTACGAGGDTETVSNSELFPLQSDRSDEFFDRDRVLKVDIQMDDAQYQTLRFEGRTMGDLLSGCFRDFEYTNFRADITIDGELIRDVGIRKKGFLGSLSPSRPSMKMNFAVDDASATYQSMRRMTLNNNRQDASATRQCITYQLFRDAGLIAPRCNFAQVSVNGQDLGYYTNVEGVDEPFLRRNFEDAGGNLYEAQLAGFAPIRKDAFQLKTNERVNDRSDLDAVISALSADDENLLPLLEQVLDVDQFLDMWAMEIITGHWDGAAGNNNNYFIYNNPRTQRFSYIPWGTDGALSPRAGLTGSDFPLWHVSFLSNRLYNIPAMRERLFANVERLIEEVFDEEAITVEMDRISDLTDSNPDAIVEVKEFAANQIERLQAAMNGEIEDDTQPLEDMETSCSNVRGHVSGQWEGNVGSFTYTDSSGIARSFNGFVNRNDLTGGALSSLSNPLTVPFNIFGVDNGPTVIALFSVEEPEFRVGETQFHGIATTLFIFDTGPDGDFGISAGGRLTIDQAGEAGEPFSGSFETELGFNNGFFGGQGN
ncbi:MAG: CotH kinase family protein [Pseudomonadales bacterium]